MRERDGGRRRGRRVVVGGDGPAASAPLLREREVPKLAGSFLRVGFVEIETLMGLTRAKPQIYIGRVWFSFVKVNGKGSKKM
jgi:hypothetical protein